MRYFLSVLFTVFAITVFAKQDYKVEFNFSQPSTLCPSIETKDETAFTVSVDDTHYIFTAGPIKLYFKKIDVFDNIPCLIVDNEDNDHRRYLMLSDQNELYVESAETASLKSIELEGDFTGNFELMKGYPGTLSMITGWSCNGNEDVHKVGYKLICNPAAILSKIIVTYVSDQAPESAPNVNTAYSITSGSELYGLDNISLTFSGENVSSVVLNDDAKLSLKDGSGKSYDLTVAKIDNLKYNVKFNDLPSGSYTLNLAEGAFIHYYQGMPANVATSSCSFSIRNSNFNYDFNNRQISNTTSFSKGIKAEDFALTKFVFGFNIYFTDGRVVTEDSDPKILESDYEKYGVSKVEPIDLHINANNVCAIQTMMADKICKCHLAKEILNDKYTGYVKIVWDEEPTSDIQDGDYVFFIPAATYGDTNFGAYLADKTSVDKATCHVNGEWELPLSISKNATGISNIPTTSNAYMKARKCIENGKIVIIKGGVKYNVAGAVIE